MIKIKPIIFRQFSRKDGFNDKINKEKEMELTI